MCLPVGQRALRPATTITTICGVDTEKKGSKMSPRINLLGQKFGRLTVIAEAGRSKHNKMLWLTRCGCDGKQKVVVGSTLISGRTQSCGCLQKESVVALNITSKATHGLSNHPLYKTLLMYAFIRDFERKMPRDVHPATARYIQDDLRNMYDKADDPAFVRRIMDNDRHYIIRDLKWLADDYASCRDFKEAYKLRRRADRYAGGGQI
jgi:hypothetical protein